MGGFGSGPQRPGGPKRTAESCRSIDTLNLRRWGLLIPGRSSSGVLSWGRDDPRYPLRVKFTVRTADTSGSVQLKYLDPIAGELDYSVHLVTTPCNYGGVRWWFVCPLVVAGRTCGRRVRKLYLSGRVFGCRHCHALTYVSTQSSDRRVYAAARDGSGFVPIPDEVRPDWLTFAVKVMRAREQLRR